MLSPLSIQLCLLTHKCRKARYLQESKTQLWERHIQLDSSELETYVRSHLWPVRVTCLGCRFSASNLVSGTASRVWCWVMCLDLAEIVTIGRVFGRWMCNFVTQNSMRRASWMEICHVYCLNLYDIYIYIYIYKYLFLYLYL